MTVIDNEEFCNSRDMICKELGRMDMKYAINQFFAHLMMLYNSLGYGALNYE
jgi:hypothetical protein